MCVSELTWNYLSASKNSSHMPVLLFHKHLLHCCALHVLPFIYLRPIIAPNFRQPTPPPTEWRMGLRSLLQTTYRYCESSIGPFFSPPAMRQFRAGLHSFNEFNKLVPFISEFKEFVNVIPCYQTKLHYKYSQSRFVKIHFCIIFLSLILRCGLLPS